MKTCKKIVPMLFWGLIGCLSQISYAANENSWFVSAGAGKSWLNLSNSSTTVSNGSNTPPYDQDYFTIKNPSPQTQIQLDAGYQWHKDRKFGPYYSAFLRYRHYFATHFNGVVDQYSLPEFENYVYQMQYTANLFTLNGKVDLFEFKRILPYVSAGAGFILNYLDDYNETALANVTPRTSPDYSSNTNIAPAFALGIGIDVRFTDNVWATFGFEHLFQGKITGKGTGSWSDTRLSFANNAKMNTVFLSISANVPDGFRS
jgi:opacity protein-like surface antigen